MYDLIFDNARLCDGTGAASVLGSLAVEDGRIVAMGRLGGAAARRRIDAEGRVLAPGFIDPHTHYDAQLAWDPLATCSPLHGVTTIVFGNCGVGVAPVRPEMRERVMQDLVGVEGIPIDVMRQGIDWRWETWGEYLDVLAVGEAGAARHRNDAELAGRLRVPVGHQDGGAVVARPHHPGPRVLAQRAPDRHVGVAHQTEDGTRRFDGERVRECLVDLHVALSCAVASATVIRG